MTIDNTAATMAAMGPTTDYEFTFVVSGATVDDEHIVDALEEQFDAMLFRGGGMDLLTVSSEGPNPMEAASRVCREILSAIPGLRFERLDRGLVGITEIAERTGRSRQNVSQWIKGERQAEQPPFPPSEGTVGRSQAWLWAEVNEWLRPLGLDDGFTYPNRDEIAIIDALLVTSKGVPGGQEVGLGQLLNMVGAAKVEVVFDIADDEYTHERELLQGRAFAAIGDHLIRNLAGSSTTTDEAGRHVVVVAASEEPARLVMERMSSYSHDVVLVAEDDESVNAIVMSRSGEAKGQASVVLVPSDATMRDWLKLMQDNPGSAFALSDAARPSQKNEPPRLRLVLSAAA